MTKPTHIAYIVTDAKEGSDKKANWREVGALFPHTSGDGFNLVIHPCISVSSKIVIRERKEVEAAA
jgi:hypothetical protein